MKTNVMGFLNRGRENDNAEEKEEKRPVKAIQREREVKSVQKYINELEPDALFVAQKVHALGRKPLEEAVVQKCEGYHRRKYREHVAGMKQGYANAANHAKNQLPPLYKKREEMEKALGKIPQIDFIKNEGGKKLWTNRDKRIFLLFVVLALGLIGAAASAIEAVVITGFPALSAHPFRAWGYGIFGGLAGAGGLYALGYTISKHSEKAARIYFLLLEIIGVIATILLVIAIANVGMGTGSGAVVLDFTNASSATGTDTTNDFMLVFAEVLAEWIGAAVCIRKAVEKFMEHGAPTIAKDNADYGRILEQLADLNRDISDWEEKQAGNNSVLAVIGEGEERYIAKSLALLGARFHQNRLSYGILD